jgi:HK97 family phage major capsid protein
MSNRSTLLSDAQRIITRAKDAGRPMTTIERKSVRDALDRAKQIDRDRDKSDGDELRKQLADCLREGPRRDGKSGRFSSKTAASELATKISSGGAKALAPSGAEVAPAGLTELPPLSLTKPSRSLLAAIPSQIVEQPPTFSFLRQVTRTNLAAPVASGGEKPVSAYGLERVEDRLRVIAHLSEKIDRFWLEDHEQLRTFVQDELTYGLDLAVEQQVLNGSGVGENNRGMLQTSGILTQAWSTDGLVTLRKAQTQLQIVGAETVIAVLNPVDFETLSLLRSTTNEFIATDANSYNDTQGSTSPPYGPLALSSWGMPVVLTTAIAAGQGVVFDPSAVVLYTDGNVRVEWDSSVGFSTNELTARCEGRFGVAVTRPDRIVSVDMSAA